MSEAARPSSDSPTDEKVDLLLLAGLLCDESMWQDVAEQLCDVARITIFSFAGFSSLGDMADQVLASAPSRFVLIGHSMGGRVALEMVRKAPDRVRALGLFNTGVHPRGEHEPASRGRLVALAKDAGMRALAQEWLPPMLDAENVPPRPLVERLTAMVERSSPESFEGQVAALLDRPDAGAVLPSVRVPTLLMSATGDRWSPVEQHEAMRRDIPDATLVVVENAGHMAPAEQPGAVAFAIREWLGRLGQERLCELDLLAIEARCKRQIHRYARLNDAADFDGLARLYTTDAVFARPSEPDTHIRGREAILASLQKRPPRVTRHIMAGIEVDVESSTRARARSIVLLFAGDGASHPSPITATLVGTFDDVLENVDGEWLFAQRLGAVGMKG